MIAICSGIRAGSIAWARSQSLCPGWSDSSKAFMNEFLWYNTSQSALQRYGGGGLPTRDRPCLETLFGCSDLRRLRYAVARIGSAGILATRNLRDVILTADRPESLRTTKPVICRSIG